MANYGPREAYPSWTESEVAALIALFPAAPWTEIERKLPMRSRGAIGNYARKTLGLHRHVNQRKAWTAAEIATLDRLYLDADPRAIEEALVGRSFSTCQRKACELGLRRLTMGTRKNRRFVHPIVQELRKARERKKLSRVDIADMIGYHPNNLLAWELGKARPLLHYVTDLAEALGFEVVLKEKMTREIMDSMVIPYPDRKKLMGGR